MSVRRVWKVRIKISKVFKSPSVGSIFSVICYRGSLWSRRALWGNIAAATASATMTLVSPSVRDSSIVKELADGCGWVRSVDGSKNSSVTLSGGDCCVVPDVALKRVWEGALDVRGVLEKFLPLEGPGCNPSCSGNVSETLGSSIGDTDPPNHGSEKGFGCEISWQNNIWSV